MQQIYAPLDYGRYFEQTVKLKLIERFVKQGVRNSKSLKSLSFSRCLLDDESVETICSSLKYLPNVETLDFSHCDLSVKGAESITNMIKHQKIQRFSESWQRSLRYRAINHETIPGLVNISLNFNPGVGDEGLLILLEVLKEDAWIKKVEMRGCCLTDLGAYQISECLKLNKTIAIFDIAKNPDISNPLYRHIAVQLGSEESGSDDEPVKLSAPQLL